MAKDKEIKTNAMRILDSLSISYKVTTYTCDEFVDGISVADMLGIARETMYKTLVTSGKGGYFVFVIGVEQELDLKAAARAVGEKAVELIHVKDINKITGYIRGGCTAIGMKKDYPTVIDENCILYDEITVSGGKIGAQVTLSPDDFMRATGAKALPIIH